MFSSHVLGCTARVYRLPDYLKFRGRPMHRLV